MLGIILLVLFLGGVFWFLYKKKNKPRNMTASVLSLQVEQVALLEGHIPFFRALTTAEKDQFQRACALFLAEKKIVPIKTNIDELDRMYIAASAVIPIFRLPFWSYDNLDEVIVYPSAFDYDFQIGTGGTILGMVGTGVMEGKMVLSKKALRHGFSNTTDKRNTAIHEFIHLVDMADGQADGIPEVLLENSPALPWIEFMRHKIDGIRNGKSDIDSYGGTQQVEFFAVASEYFFERPKLLKKKHPELYDALSGMFGTNLAAKPKMVDVKVEVGRNDPCPCGSGKKYKKCCGGN